MTHNNKNIKLGRKKSHRVALTRNQMKSLIIHGKVDTTITKANVLKANIDKLMTLAKQTDRKFAEIKLLSIIPDEKVIAMLFDKYLVEYKDINSGYTQRVLLQNRKGDDATMARVTWAGHMELK